MVQNIIIPGRHILILFFIKRVFLVTSYANISGPPPGISITTASERVFSWLDQKRHPICRASAPRRVSVSFFFHSQPNPIIQSTASRPAPPTTGLELGGSVQEPPRPFLAGEMGARPGRGCWPFSSRGLRLERARPAVDSLPANPQRVERPTRTCADGRA